MRVETQQAVDQWCADRLGIDSSALWREVTVTSPDEGCDDHESWSIYWRGKGVHVCAPATTGASDVASLLGSDHTELQQPDFWRAFASQRAARMIGPVTHGCLDEDPGLPEDVEQIDPVRLTLLRKTTTAEEWHESGFAQAINVGLPAIAIWGPMPGSEHHWVPALLGGAALTGVAGADRDIRVLVASPARGRGHGLALARAAAAYAVSWHGWARWRTPSANEPATRIAARLGFEAYATELSITP
ncbi:GNAT family N-acetyltransferase [Nocardioides sp.]|uniref:GNAT family N-acetyltransferase n=1 Tax=Nocardioides sp. TaxID=35761 RepID=UPI0035647145